MFSCLLLGKHAINQLLCLRLPISSHINSHIQITCETSHFYNDFDL
nr:MAG TPA: hypothetical protein [Caudoviricetes sp.]